MQSASPAGPQRPTQSQRRQQTSADQMQASAPTMNPPYSEGSQVRSSSGSGRSGRTANPDKQISQIEKSVTHLLVATKQLLETLTQWSRGQAQEEEVSDVYVRLGYEFNLACRAFNSIGVETSDLGPVPDLLRSILEDTLSQPASPQALDNYLPRIRDIIINLLHGLKRKQSRLRGRATKDPTATPQSRQPTGQVRQSSVSTTGSSETGLTHMLDDVPSAASSIRGPTPQQDNIAASEYAPGNASAIQASKSPENRQSLRRNVGPQLPQSETSSTMSSNTAQNLPVMPPYQDAEQAPPAPHINFPHPPPPPPKQTDALARLQRGGDLERRASRRFSAYQIQKHLGASPNGVPVIPTAQNSPIPNRGKEVRESLTAVRSRSSYNHSRSRSSRQGDVSPSRSGTVRAPSRILEEREDTPVLSLESVPQMRPPEDSMDIDSPTVKTPDEYFRAPPNRQGTGSSDRLFSLGATVNGPLEPPPEELQDTASIDSQPAPQPTEHKAPVDEAGVSSPETVQHKTRTNVTPTQSQVMTLDSSPPQGKELTLFLQYRSKIKKFVLADGYEELTIPRLQLAFIEKFAWNTQHDGGELPEIYVQDQVSGVRHELEDLSDVKDRSVLVLNVEQLDEVKKHIDEGLGGLQRSLEGVRSLLEGQGTLMQRFSDRQLETSKEMARMSAVPASASRTPTLTPGNFTASAAPTSSTLQEVQNLRREIAVLRQTYSTMSSDFTAAMTDIKSKAAGVKVAAAEAANAAYKGDAGRSHINQGKKTLSNDSEALVNRVDDLSDIVEELRKDVVTRGVRPLPRQLEDISKEISAAAKQLTKVKDFVKREKPVWTKIWEQELQIVMTERDDLTQQDELMNDLDGDLEDITNVFKLVEEATKQQNIQNTTTAGRNPSRSLAFDTEVDPHEAKTGVLDEVRALQPNHESRLEAIERAERVRQRELQTRKVGEFQREVENFVEEGKLKKTGGMDEVERRRKTRDEQARKENWERQQARAAELEKKRAEEAAAAAAASSNQTNGTTQESENDTSQEGEAAFEDANEESVLSPEESTSPAPQAAPVKDGGADGGGPPVPQLPELNVDEGEKGLGMSFS
ncbi:Bud site selection protein 6 [Exophiala xenobiotica]|uniref:Bud site selection protein 6 n=1 Tax=Vermiconidia calcicola TaxID=1690605 RepID=A0AAV9QCY3_9PEZI|nr:Bud site selection protein 6 [Exophiala xenobiotica]KAK5535408.1 Bud site selection protein 6 [Chaetothyriales sp. CCFEE 6169]KAK5538450.1 Bud site selection protein 6 [Vermiconidia calcicola]KAK5194278.1 Bud site selection protein 6 [Exophiala xenobiotica]KAK5222195.1 Bud site selection protein 6 [Exophiala xenobiotica]